MEGLGCRTVNVKNDAREKLGILRITRIQVQSRSVRALRQASVWRIRVQRAVSSLARLA
jgi:hypothetical protein